jgi:prepilin-type N-terminal cleavage/methylation domain-containing protein
MIRGMRARIDAVGRDDRGITMVELLVAMMIVTVLSVIVIGTYQSVTQSLTTANSLNRNTSQASNGMNEAARQIRAATSNPVAGATINDPAIVQAANETLVMYAYVNLQSSSAQLPVMVRLRVDPTTRKLVEDLWPATQNSAGYWIFPATTTAPTTTRYLADTVASQTGTNPYIFTYLAGTAPLTVPTAGTFTADQLRSITAIQITLTIQSSLTVTSQSVTLQNTVGMPNLTQ